MREYLATREPSGALRVRVAGDGQIRDLPLRLDLANHSPSGFECGYVGSGPAQLALALLADALVDWDETPRLRARLRDTFAPMEASDALALILHQPFTWAVVTGLDHDGWTLPVAIVRQHAASLAASVAPARRVRRATWFNRHRARYERVKAIICADFPGLFDQNAPKPLALCIDQQLREHYGGSLTWQDVRVFRRFWCSQLSYQRALISARFRHGLPGVEVRNPTMLHISDEQRRNAREILERRNAGRVKAA